MTRQKRAHPPVSRKWLNRHFNTSLDRMSATAVQQQGWTEQEIVRLGECVGTWNRILKSDLKLLPFGERAEKPGGGRAIGETCSEDGVLYLNLTGSNYMHCPDIFVAHENGHYRELVQGGFQSSKRMREVLNRYRQPGMRDREIISPKQVAIPPAGIPTWHDGDVRDLLDGLEGHIGSNFREVNCDTIAFQKHDVSRVGLRDLVGQHLNFIEIEKEHLAQDIGGCGSHEVHIPVMARFAAGAWSMSVLAREILHDEQLARRAEQLPGLNTTRRLEGGVDVETPGSFEEIIKQGLSEEHLLAFAVVTQAYKEHFIASLGMRGLFKKERMEAHLERLDPQKSDLSTRINEAIFLGQMGDRRFTDALVGCLDDPVRTVQFAAIEALEQMKDGKAIPALIEKAERDEDPEIRGAATFAFAGVAEANPGNNDALDYRSRLVQISRHGDAGSNFVAQSALAAIVRANPTDQEVLAGLSDVFGSARDESAALSAWSSAAESNPGCEEVLGLLPQIVAGFDAEQSFNRIMAFGAFQNAVKSNPGNPTILKYVPDLVKHFDDEPDLAPDAKDQSIVTWGYIAEANPGNSEVLKHTPKVMERFRDPNRGIQETALRAWERAAKASPEDPRILETKGAAAQCVRKILFSAVQDLDELEYMKRYDAVATIGELSKTSSGNREPLLFLPLVLGQFKDEKPEVQARALKAWGDVAEAHPGEEVVLDSTPDVVEKFGDDEYFVRKDAMEAWSKAVKANPDDPLLLEHIPKIANRFSDPNHEVRGTAVKVWGVAAEANPDHPLIRKTRAAYEKAAP